MCRTGVCNTNQLYLYKWINQDERWRRLNIAVGSIDDVIDFQVFGDNQLRLLRSNGDDNPVFVQITPTDTKTCTIRLPDPFVDSGGNQFNLSNVILASEDDRSGDILYALYTRIQGGMQHIVILAADNRVCDANPSNDILVTRGGEVAIDTTDAIVDFDVHTTSSSVGVLLLTSSSVLIYLHDITVSTPQVTTEDNARKPQFFTAGWAFIGIGENGADTLFLNKLNSDQAYPPGEIQLLDPFGNPQGILDYSVDSSAAAYLVRDGDRRLFLASNHHDATLGVAVQQSSSGATMFDSRGQALYALDGICL